MENQMNTQHQQNTNKHWPPSEDELVRFSHPSAVDGYSAFALRRDYNHNSHVMLMLMPLNPMRGAPVVAECTREFKWTVTCDYSIVSAVSAAIQRAEVFLLNLNEPKRPSIPDVVPPHGLKWVSVGDVAGVKTPALVHCGNWGSVVETVPASQLQRDAMLACVEAFESKTRVFAEVSEHGSVSNIVVNLAPGRYAVSFRKLPRKEDQ